MTLDGVATVRGTDRNDRHGGHLEPVVAIRRLGGPIAGDRRDIAFPAIVGGDFNADPASDEVRILTGRHRAEDTSTALFDAWEFVDPAEPGWTWDNDNPCVAPTLQPNRRIDYVFVGWPRAGGAGNVVEAHTVVPQSVAGPMASDHKAVIARLRY